jgi:hypothetical protein
MDEQNELLWLETPWQNNWSFVLLMELHCDASCGASPLQSARVSGSTTLLQLGAGFVPPLETP